MWIMCGGVYFQVLWNEYQNKTENSIGKKKKTLQERLNDIMGTDVI